MLDLIFVDDAVAGDMIYQQTLIRFWYSLIILSLSLTQSHKTNLQGDVCSYL